MNTHIIPDLPIYRLIKTDIEQISYLQTSGTCKINFKNSEGKDISYIGMTKKKIEASIKEVL